MKRNISSNRLRNLYLAGAVMVFLGLVVATWLRNDGRLADIANMTVKEFLKTIGGCLFLVFVAHLYVKVRIDDQNLYISRLGRTKQIPFSLVASVEGVEKVVTRSYSTWNIRITFKETTPMGDELVFPTFSNDSRAKGEHRIVAQLKHLAGISSGSPGNVPGAATSPSHSIPSVRSILCVLPVPSPSPLKTATPVRSTPSPPG